MLFQMYLNFLFNNAQFGLINFKGFTKKNVGDIEYI